MRFELAENRLRLKFVEDPKTRAKLTGISARRIGLESKYYEILDKKSLEDEEGFRIFAFHSGITEFKPEYLSEMETLPIFYFPRGLDYYAGGHIHERGEHSLPGYDRVVFPGPLFTGYGRDIETTAKGEKRGFYMVEFDDRVRSVKFVENETFPGTFIEVDADGKNSVQVGNELEEAIGRSDANHRVVVIKVRGELSGGKTSDIDFAKLRNRLMESGSLYVYINRYGLTSKEFAVPTLGGEDPATIERNMFGEKIQNVHVSSDALKGEPGAAVARELLKSLRVDAKQGESKRDYADRMVESGVQTLNIKRMFQEVKEER
jgi:DNA repair exonuclease SbcCD nuclease subunit